ncbi:MAG: hypothetical protein U9P90_02850 [Patescibacteria group bacterium]|nr:hypothetical protein [Patescibacteria group bacterium]
MTKIFFYIKLRRNKRTLKTKEEKDMRIGPSTRWMYASGLYLLNEQEKILRAVKTSSVEIILDAWEGARINSLRNGKAFDVAGLSYRSLHLPGLVYTLETKDHVATARQLVDSHRMDTVLIHPTKVNGDYPVDFYEELVSNGVPLAIENMDKNKDSGFDINELEGLVKSIDLGFVLDVQHAYEHDITMQYANDLFEVSIHHLLHLHVSGETANSNHSLVHKSRNAMEFLKKELGR